MPRVLFHGSIQGLRGQIGNLIFRLLPDGTTVVTEAPPEKTRRQKKRAKLRRSAAQKAHNSRFQEAVAYAKQAQVQPVYVELAAVRPMNNAYNLALGDWLKPPDVHRIERREGCVRVEASDNILVTRVQVTVLDGDGSVLDRGEAVRGEGNWWEYAACAPGKTVIAEAWDLPGNVTKLVFPG